ncbi:hypothetical protein [uncultured Flavobacterium sp.]|uniref:hypothetical protein n=1 Tax=uncultured Flavobacterium sp. TaxID=165435 RepID=UPI0025F925B3|nr:hypothetical protein [uncultured Flavobacterium sp.]
MEKKNNSKISEASEVLQEKASTYFKENPKAKRVFGADEFLFTVKKYAVNHAQTVEGSEVFTFKNPNSIEVVDPEEVDDDSDDDDSDDDDSPASGTASTQKITQ